MWETGFLWYSFRLENNGEHTNSTFSCSRTHHQSWIILCRTQNATSEMLLGIIDSTVLVSTSSFISQYRMSVDSWKNLCWSHLENARHLLMLIVVKSTSTIRPTCRPTSPNLLYSTSVPGGTQLRRDGTYTAFGLAYLSRNKGKHLSWMTVVSMVIRDDATAMLRLKWWVFELLLLVRCELGK